MEGKGACRVCEAQFGRYTCPRCGAPYCTVACYKAHNQDCTESFASDALRDNLSAQRVAPEEVGEMVAMMKRSRQFADSAGEGDDHNTPLLDDNDLKELEQLDLGVEELMDELSVQERAEFERQLRDGSLANFVQPWLPWWRDKRCLIVEVASPDASNAPLGVPTLLTPIPPFDELSKRPPSPLLIVHAVELTFAYAFTMRLVNGDAEGDAHEAVRTMVRVSSVLQGTNTPPSPRAAVNAALQRAAQAAALGGSRELSVLALGDAACILALGAKGFQLVVSHVHALLGLCDKHASLQPAPHAALANNDGGEDGHGERPAANHQRANAQQQGQGKDSGRGKDKGGDGKQPPKPAPHGSSRATPAALRKKMEFLCSWGESVHVSEWRLVTSCVDDVAREMANTLPHAPPPNHPSSPPVPSVLRLGVQAK